MILNEIEIGPHFITLYTKDYMSMLKCAEKMYALFCKEVPELAPIQQQDFLHEPNDPNVYHPFGEPNHWRPHFRHFHIRYGRKPNEQDINWVLSKLKDCGITPVDKDIPITYLTDNRLEKFKNKVYPPIAGNYLEYIDELRTGDWLK